MCIRDRIKENGWAAVSIRSVAAKCSVSAGTIYNYYESKAELLGATIELSLIHIFLHLCNGNKKKQHLAAAFQLLLPGMPMIYYGDEFAMPRCV